MSFQILRALRRMCKPEPHVPVSLIPWSRAMLCAESKCVLVWNAEESPRCPACGSDGVPLARREVLLAQRAAARIMDQMKGGQS